MACLLKVIYRCELCDVFVEEGDLAVDVIITCFTGCVAFAANACWIFVVGTFSQVRFLTKIYHPNIDKVSQRSHPTDRTDK